MSGSPVREHEGVAQRALAEAYERWFHDQDSRPAPPDAVLRGIDDMVRKA